MKVTFLVILLGEEEIPNVFSEVDETQSQRGTSAINQACV